jgi:hypothetical protein
MGIALIKGMVLAQMHAISKFCAKNILLTQLWKYKISPFHYTMLVSLSVIVHLGFRIAGVVCFRSDISQTSDAVVRHVGYMMYAYGTYTCLWYTGRGPDNQNSTSTVGAVLESSKKLLPTDDVIQKIKWRGAVSSIQQIKNIIFSEREKFYIFKVWRVCSSGLQDCK